MALPKEKLPQFTEEAYPAFKMRQAIKLIEKRFESLEREISQISPSTGGDGDPVARSMMFFLGR